LGEIEEITGPVCARCGRPMERSGGLCSECAAGETEFFLARSFGHYKPGGLLARGITGLKYKGEKALARELGPLLDRGYTGELMHEAQAITYVPLSSEKLADRGFNQARLLATFLGRKVDLPVIKTLRKTKVTSPQAELGRKERLVNVRDCFDVIRPISVDSILLVDDVFTTGSTVNECSKVLKLGGAKRVFVATLARSYPD